MEIIGDMINLVKNLVSEIRLQKTDQTVQIIMVDVSRIQLIDLKYSPDYAFPINFANEIGLDVEKLGAIDSLFSAFKREYTGEADLKMWYEDQYKETPEIKATQQLIDMGDMQKLQLPEIHSNIRFWGTDEFDCKKKNILIQRGDIVYLGELVRGYETKIVNERPYAQVDEVLDSAPISYHVLPLPYFEKMSKQCKAINAFLKVFGGAWFYIGYGDILMLEANKQYLRDEVQLELEARLLSAPIVSEHIEDILKPKTL